MFSPAGSPGERLWKRLVRLTARSATRDRASGDASLASRGRGSLEDQIRERFARAMGPRGFERGANRRPLESTRPAPTARARAAPRQPTALETDAALLVREAELFAPAAPPLGPDAPASVEAHLMVVSAIAWLFSIDPLWRALTPRSFAGIPAPQLMAVLFAFPVIWIAVMALWARALPPGVRCFLRARCYEWRRWLALAFVALVAANQQG